MCVECPGLTLVEPVGALCVDATVRTSDVSMESLRARSAQAAIEQLSQVLTPFDQTKLIWVSLDVPRPRHHLHFRLGFWQWLRRQRPDLFILADPFGPGVSKTETPHEFNSDSRRLGEPGARLAFLGSAIYRGTDAPAALDALFEFSNYLRVSAACCLVMRQEDDLSTHERQALASALWRADRSVTGQVDHCLAIEALLRRDRLLLTAMYDHGWRIARTMIFGLTSQLFPIGSLPRSDITFVDQVAPE